MENYLNRIKSKLLVKIIYPIYYLVYELFHDDYLLVAASVKPHKYNWGDDMSIVLAKFLCPSKKIIPSVYTWNTRKNDNYLCIGSIISWMTTSKSIIWGSGVVYPNRKISAHPKTVCAVRGPLTRQYLLKQGIDCPEIYGDPALLFPKYYQPKSQKKYKLGIIPHFRDKKNEVINRFKEEDVLIIDVQNITPWHRFIDDICSCEKIVSSSLHGIIISDAYQIPNAWIEFKDGEKKRYAFLDYFASVKREIQEPSLILDNTTTTEQLELLCSSYKNIVIDLDLLLKSCPFLSSR